MDKWFVNLSSDTVKALLFLAEEHMYQGGNVVENKHLEQFIQELQQIGYFEEHI